MDHSVLASVSLSTLMTLHVTSVSLTTSVIFKSPPFIEMYFPTSEPPCAALSLNSWYLSDSLP